MARSRVIGLALGRGRANVTAAELAPGVARPQSCSIRSVGGAPIASQIRCAPAAIGAERADSPKASYIWGPMYDWLADIANEAVRAEAPGAPWFL